MTNVALPGGHATRRAILVGVCAVKNLYGMRMGVFWKLEEPCGTMPLQGTLGTMIGHDYGSYLTSMRCDRCSVEHKTESRAPKEHIDTRIPQTMISKVILLLGLKTSLMLM